MSALIDRSSIRGKVGDYCLKPPLRKILRDGVTVPLVRYDVLVSDNPMTLSRKAFVPGRPR